MPELNTTQEARYAEVLKQFNKEQIASFELIIESLDEVAMAFDRLEFFGEIKKSLQIISENE